MAKLKTERQEYDGKGGIRGTGKITEWDVQAVYRAVGYRSDEVKGVPFDHRSAVIPNDGGHVIDSATRDRVPGLYTTGWIKRGPVGLIGNTKSDAKETTDMLLSDYRTGKLPAPANPDREQVLELLESRNIAYTTWKGWYNLDAHERALGEAEGRERKKVVEWEDMVKYAHPERDA